MSQTIRNRAAIVTFSCGAFTGKRVDRRVTEEVRLQHGHAGRGNYQKYLLEDGTKRVLRARTAAYNAHYAMTAPWGNAGVRIIKADMIQEYLDKMRQLRREFYAALDDMIDALPQLLREEAEAWVGLFNINDYPSVDELRRKHYFDVTVEPLAETGGDWRLELSDDLLAELASNYDAEYDARLKEAMHHTWDRLHTALASLSEKLHKDKTKGFRQSVINGVVEVARSLNGLNFTADPEMDAMAKAVIDKLGNTQAEVIRSSPEVKDKTQADVDAIMADMAVFMG